MKVCVIDTSALLRFYIPDGPLALNSEAMLDLLQSGDLSVYAPELIWAEIAQVLLKKERLGILTSQEAREIQDEIFSLPIDLVSHKELIDSAATLSRAHGLSIYDGLYLALSERLRCRLMTCDDKLFHVSKILLKH